MFISTFCTSLSSLHTHLTPPPLFSHTPPLFPHTPSSSLTPPLFPHTPSLPSSLTSPSPLPSHPPFLFPHIPLPSSLTPPPLFPHIPSSLPSHPPLFPPPLPFFISPKGQKRKMIQGMPTMRNMTRTLQNTAASVSSRPSSGN